MILALSLVAANISSAIAKSVAVAKSATAYSAWVGIDFHGMTVQDVQYWCVARRSATWAEIDVPVTEVSFPDKKFLVLRAYELKDGLLTVFDAKTAECSEAVVGEHGDAATQPCKYFIHREGPYLPGAEDGLKVASGAEGLESFLKPLVDLTGWKRHVERDGEISYDRGLMDPGLPGEGTSLSFDHVSGRLFGWFVHDGGDMTIVSLTYSSADTIPLLSLPSNALRVPSIRMVLPTR